MHVLCEIKFNGQAPHSTPSPATLIAVNNRLGMKLFNVNSCQGNELVQFAKTRLWVSELVALQIDIALTVTVVY